MSDARGMDGGAWVPERTADGSWTLRHPVHGEACHSRAGAWTEARERYAGPCRLRARARSDPRIRAAGVFRVLDVGTGLGTNLAAALAALAGTGVRLAAWTLESEPEVLRAARDVLGRGGPGLPARERVLEALASAAENPPSESVALGTEGDVTLVLGDGRATLPALDPELVFDAVFLDPFSPAKDPALWEDGFLAEVARRMAPGSWLSTYSAAFRVRVGLANAGLRVGTGPRVGEKAEGTLASPDTDPPPLRTSVLARLRNAVDLSTSVTGPAPGHRLG